MQYQTRQMIFGGGAVTPAVKFLLIVNVGVFIVQTVIGSSLEQQMAFYFGLVPPLVLQNLYLWQLFTYQFLHGGLFHILFNMLALWMFGCALERRWGSEFFLKYYFVSVVGGAILNTLILPAQIVPSIGASAGVYGLLLAYGLIYPDQIVYFYFLLLRYLKLRKHILSFVKTNGGIFLQISIAGLYSYASFCG